MRREFTRAALALALGGGLVLGCRSGAPRQSYSQDPLLLSKKPVPGKPDAAETSPVPEREPTPPPPPALDVTPGAFASLPADTGDRQAGE